MLNGEQVVLRPVEREDLAVLWELVKDFEVAVLSETGPVLPVSLAAYQARFDRSLAESGSAKDWAWFAVDVEAELVGDAILYRIDHFNQRCDLGIALGRDHWGKGYGQDAVRTLVDYAFTHLNLSRVSLQCLADDPRAIAAYRKAGFEEEGRLRRHAWVRGEWHDELVMSVLRGDRTTET
jgi:RimJ/RimL family protein N-acetyltransferase